MEEMLEQVFGNLQRLEIQPTEHNVGLLGECFRALRELHEEVNRMKEDLEKAMRETGPEGPREAETPSEGLHIVREEETAPGAENGEE